MKKKLLLIQTVLLATTAFAQLSPRYIVQDAPDTIIKSRVWLVGGGTAALYAGALVALDKYWYQNYPRSRFHFFNDNGEWLQMDKFGHVFSAYFEGKYSMELWRWTGVPRKTQIWLGGLSGFAYQSVIEILDGFSAQWGFSWGDMTANTVGSVLLISQELLWNEQRIQLKFSAHRNNYGPDPVLVARTNDLYRTSLPERTLKDYNAQTYWLSVNLHAFIKNSPFPKWLNMAVGYGAEDMYGGYGNVWTDKTGTLHDYSNVPRYRQFFLSPDIDFTKIHTRKKVVKTLLTFLNMVKLPAPTLEITSKGTVKLHALYF